MFSIYFSKISTTTTTKKRKKKKEIDQLKQKLPRYLEILCTAKYLIELVRVRGSLNFIDTSTTSGSLCTRRRDDGFHRQDVFLGSSARRTIPSAR
jgi:hypothetical protein